jgi:hypothetical protein
MEACLISDPKLIWDDVSAWSSSAWKGKSFAAIVCKAQPCCYCLPSLEASK